MSENCKVSRLYGHSPNQRVTQSLRNLGREVCGIVSILVLAGTAVLLTLILSFLSFGQRSVQQQREHQQ